MSKRSRIVLVAIIILFILGMALYPKIKEYFFSENTEPDIVESAPNRSRILNVNALILKPENLDDIVRGTGRLLPDEEVDLAFETSGKITDIYFKEGTSVKKGELLAKVNDAPLQAELKKLIAQVPLAEDRVYRQKALFAKDAVSLESYESVNTELEKLKADIELMKARIEQTELRAPFDGVIGLRQVSEGAYVSPTTFIARLTKVSPLKLEFFIPETQASHLKVGTKISFTESKADDKRYIATVYALEPNLDEFFSLKFRALAPNPSNVLTPGRSVNVEVKVREIQNTIVVPSLSVIAEMGRDIAYLYKDGKAHQVTLTKGMRTESAIQITKGLSVGDTLIVTGVMQLRDGLPVKVDRFVTNEDTN